MKRQDCTLEKEHEKRVADAFGEYAERRGGLGNVGRV